MTEKPSTFSLIGDRYLDTQHDDDYIDSIERQLRSRGIVGVKRVIVEYIAASSLWWNVIWWEWGSLDERDVKAGWGCNLVVFAVAAVVSGALWGLWASLFCVLACHGATLWIGLGLRSGTKLNP